MSEITCPYCGHEYEIFGVDDGYVQTANCIKCEKYFLYVTECYVRNHTKKADCLNGGEHNYHPILRYPEALTILRCVDCKTEREMTREDWEKL